MRRYDTLKNAPITEALIDLRVELPPGANFNTIQKISEKVASTYPDVKTRNLFRAEFRLEGEKEPETETKKEQDGLVFTSAGKNRVFQATLSGFTFSWLKPYKNWKAFSTEAKTLWKIYAAEVEPINIIRVGTRFINRLELPADLRDFKDYLTAVPEIPPRLPQNLISFFSRVVIPSTEIGAIAIITQASLDPVQTGDKNFLPILLDIDVYRETIFEPDGKRAWEVLEELRNEKNRIFFESITETLERFFR